MAVLEELGSKLTDIAGIKVSFPLQNDKDLILKIYARLCLLYDETWDFGDASFSLSCKKILRLLNRVGIAHLTPTAADVVDPRRLPRVWSAFIAHLEQKYGSQGLYPRLRKVLKQQQILAARSEAERERQQRMAGSARSPSKPRLGDISTSSALSQDSQEDVRFAKPHPPLQKVRHASASSSGSTVSPSKAGARSRIPVPTKPNVIPTGKQLARTPSLHVKSAATAATGPAPPASMVQVFGSPRLVAPKPAAAAPAAPSGSATDASPERRRSLIPAPKSPEQALGEYIESRLNAGFPHEAEVPAELTATAASPAPSAPAAATGAALNVTYSAERPVAAPRPAGLAPSPAADAREAILQAAEDAADKENVRPAAVEPAVSGKPAGKVEEDSVVAAARGVRRDTYEVTPAPVNPEQPAGRGEEADTVVQPSSAQTVPIQKRDVRAVKAGAKDPLPAAEVAPAPETSAETAQESTADAQKTEAPKKRGGRAKGAKQAPSKDAPLSGVVEAAPAPEVDAAAQAVTDTTADTADQTKEADSAPAEAQPVQAVVPAEEVPKKRRGRAKKEAKTSDESASSAPVPEGDAAAQAVTDTPADTADQTKAPAEAHPVQEVVPAEEVPKKRRGRAKKDTKTTDEGVSSAPVPEGDAAAQAVTDTPADTADQTKAADSAPAEAQPVQAVVPADEVPKKRRGRAKKETKTTDESASSAPVPEGDAAAQAVPDTPADTADQTKAADSAPAEAQPVQEVVPVEEVPKKRRGRAKKEAKTTDEGVSSAPVPESDAAAQAVTDTPVGSADQTKEADSAPAEAQPVQEVVPAEEVPKKRRGRAKKEAKTTDESASSAPALEGDAAAQAVIDTPVDTADQTKVVESVPAEAQPVQAVVPAEEVPKKRRGRAKKETKTSDESASSVNTVPAMVESAPEFAPVVPQSGTEQPAAELTEQGAKPARASRRKTAAQPQKSTDSESAPAAPESVPAATESVPAVPESGTEQPAAELTEQAAKPARARASRRKTVARPQKSADSESAPAATDSVPAVPQSAPAPTAPESVPVLPESGTEQPEAELTEKPAPARASRRKTVARQPKNADSESAPAVIEPAPAVPQSAPVPTAPESVPPVPESVPVLPESVPVLPESGTEQPEAELTEQAAKSAPARASRRKTVARPQKSTDSESADGADPTWAPDEPVAGARRGRRAARQKSHPAVSCEEAAASESDPAAVRGPHAESSEPSAEQSVQTAEPSGGRTGRATRASRASTDPATAADTSSAAGRRSARGGRNTAEESAEAPPPPRRRRLRVVLESDSEDDTSPARADVTPSPAAPQHTRRARKTDKETGPPRRALRALDNCN